MNIANDIKQTFTNRLIEWISIQWKSVGFTSALFGSIIINGSALLSTKIRGEQYYGVLNEWLKLIVSIAPIFVEIIIIPGIVLYLLSILIISYTGIIGKLKKWPYRNQEQIIFNAVKLMMIGIVIIGWSWAFLVPYNPITSSYNIISIFSEDYFSPTKEFAIWVFGNFYALICLWFIMFNIIENIREKDKKKIDSLLK